MTSGTILVADDEDEVVGFDDPAIMWMQATQLARSLHDCTQVDLDRLRALPIEQMRASALLVAADPFFDTRRELIIKFAAQNKLPAIYPYREYVELGGLIAQQHGALQPRQRDGVEVHGDEQERREQRHPAPGPEAEET